MEISCEVIKDLLPLYADEVCSEKSKELVQEHMKGCGDCQKLYQNMKEEKEPVSVFLEENLEEIQPFKKIKKRMWMICACSVFGIVALIFLLVFAGKEIEKRNNTLKFRMEAEELSELLEETQKRMEKKWNISDKATMLDLREEQEEQEEGEDPLTFAEEMLLDRGNYNFYLYDKTTGKRYQIRFFWNEKHHKAKVTVVREKGMDGFLDTGISFFALMDCLKQATNSGLSLPFSSLESQLCLVQKWTKQKFVRMVYSDGKLRNCRDEEEQTQIPWKYYLDIRNISYREDTNIYYTYSLRIGFEEAQ